MAMTAQELNLYNNRVERLKAILSDLTYDELGAVESVAKTFIMSRSVESPYHPLTEAQFAERIDRSLEHAAQGLCQDSEEMEAELIAEFGL